MSLPATIILGVHVFAAAVLLSACYQALFARTVSLLPQRATYAMALILVITGLNNFMQRMASGIPKQYHMWFGVKFLLALHVLVMVLICVSSKTKTQDEKRRLLAGAGVSSLFVILMSVFLGYLATH